MSKLEINLDSTSLGSSGCILNFVRTTIGEPSDPTKGAYRQKINKVELNYGIATHKFIDLMYKTRGDMKYARDVSQEWFKKTPHYPSKTKAWMSNPRHLLTTCFQVWTIYIETDSAFEVLSIPGECVYCGGDGKKLKAANMQLNEQNKSEFVSAEYEPCDKCNGTGKVDSQSATECNFSIPYYEDDHIVVNLCGTIDRIGKFKGGVYCIRDWKTTGSRSENTFAKNEYFVQYELSRQLRLYTLACKIMHERYPKSIMGQIGATHMGAAIDAIFVKPNANDTECQMSEVMSYSDEELAGFQVMLTNFCKRLSKAVETNEYPKEGILNGLCEQKWSRCQYWVPCKLGGQTSQAILNRDYKRVIYNPLNFND